MRRAGRSGGGIDGGGLPGPGGRAFEAEPCAPEIIPYIDGEKRLEEEGGDVAFMDGEGEVRRVRHAERAAREAGRQGYRAVWGGGLGSNVEVTEEGEGNRGGEGGCVGGGEGEEHTEEARYQCGGAERRRARAGAEGDGGGDSGRLVVGGGGVEGVGEGMRDQVGGGEVRDRDRKSVV